MAIGIKSLADGQLAVTKGTIYTTAASTQTIIKTITLVNTAGSTVRVNLYFKATGGTSRRIIPKDTELEAGNLLIMDDEQTLEAADIIEGDASSGTTIDYVVSGVEDA